MDSLELKKKIDAAFADVGAPVRPLINHECDECLQLQEDFAGMSWTEVPPSLITENFSNLSLFSAEAFHAFIPAYLLHSLENFDGDDMVSEFAAYALLPEGDAIKDDGHSNWWKHKLSLFSDEQFAVLLDYLDLVERLDGYFDRSLLRRGRERLLRLRELSAGE